MQNNRSSPNETRFFVSPSDRPIKCNVFNHPRLVIAAARACAVAARCDADVDIILCRDDIVVGGDTSPVVPAPFQRVAVMVVDCTCVKKPRE
jgi:hypothetical protein